MSCFSKVSAVAADGDLDLTKHVNYTSGMILGVDDFTQEFAYLAGRDRWLARDALGYGTVSGLSVRVENDTEKGPQVMVEPGTAISPRGQLICVPSAQCAFLNQWLAAADAKKLDAAVNSAMTSPPNGSDLKLYVVLCYRECQTDSVPIPGEPCRSEDELTAASRIKDDFSLELRYESPKQSEEFAVRRYVEWLKQITVTNSGVSTDFTDFLQAIRAEWLEKSSPPLTSPPIVLQIAADEVCEYMRGAFCLWVTELRNVLSERETGCGTEMSGGGKLEDCVLLAELRIPLIQLLPGWKVNDGRQVTISEEDRPFLLHLRMIQDWMLCGCNCQTEVISPITSPPLTSPPVINPPVTSPPIVSPPLPPSYKLNDLTDVFAPSPNDGQILIFKAGQWIADKPDPAPAGVTNHGDLTGLADDDHKQYLLADGSRALTGNLDGGGKRITKLAAAKANGEAVVFEQVIKVNDAAGGDLNDKYPNPMIAALQGNPIKANAPSKGDILLFDGSQWITQTPAAFIILPLATITMITSNSYEIWFNIAAPKNQAEVGDFPREALTVSGETDTASLVDRNFSKPVPGHAGLKRNVYLVTFLDNQNVNFMRFIFHTNLIKLKTPGGTLAEYAEQSSIKFAGNEFETSGLATIFVRSSNIR